MNYKRLKSVYMKEDMALERITPEMFGNLTKNYEEEKKNLKKRIEELSNAINLNKDT